MKAVNLLNERQSLTELAVICTIAKQSVEGNQLASYMLSS